MKKISPILASIGSVSVMLLAFLIPSLQDQWDRYQSRRVIQQYVSMGDEFMEEERFGMAEQSYAKAFQLSEEKRIDVEMKRLHAKISRISVEPEWGSKMPEDIEEVDFQFLLHLQQKENKVKERVSTLNNYGIYLVSYGRLREAGDIFTEALTLDSTDVLAYVNYGNLLDQQGKKNEAEKLYLKAVRLEPQNARAHYNLGLLYLERDQKAAALEEFRKVLEIDPGEADAKKEYELLTAGQPQGH